LLYIDKGAGLMNAFFQILLCLGRNLEAFFRIVNVLLDFMHFIFQPVIMLVYLQICTI